MSSFIQIKYLCISHTATPVAVRQIDTQTAALLELFEMKVSLWRPLSAKEINFTTEMTLFHGPSSCQRQVNSTFTSWHCRRQEESSHHISVHKSYKPWKLWLKKFTQIPWFSLRNSVMFPSRDDSSDDRPGSDRVPQGDHLPLLAV